MTVSWHNSGCRVDQDDIGKIKLIRVTTTAGERTLHYKCDECLAKHAIVAKRTKAT